MHRTLATNIPLIALFKFLRSALFLMPVIVLFFQDRGLDMTQVFILQSIFAVGILLFEVPTGYLGDILHRKKTLLIGASIVCIGRILFAVAPGFRWLVVAELILSLWFSLYSGTDTALLYDSLLAVGKEQQFKQVQGKTNAREYLGEATAALIGARVATFQIDRPIYLQLGASILAFFVLLHIAEPPREHYHITETGWKQLLGLIRYALYTHSQISTLIIVSACIGISTYFRVWIAQPYWTLLDIPLARFGILRAWLHSSLWLFSLVAHKLERWTSETTILVACIPWAIGSYVLLAIFPSLWILPIMFVFYAIRAIKNVTVDAMLNALTSSKERATIFSIESMTFRALFILLGPLIGRSIDATGLLDAFVVIAWLLGCLFVLCLILLRRSSFL